MSDNRSDWWGRMQRAVEAVEAAQAAPAQRGPETPHQAPAEGGCMSNPVHPMAATQRPILGTARLAEPGTEVELLALATDQIGRPFYIVNPGGTLFGAWPEELTDIELAPPAKEQP